MFEALTPLWLFLDIELSKKQLRLNGVLNVKLCYKVNGNLVKRREITGMKSPCEDVASGWPSASQGKKAQEKSNLLAPWSWLDKQWSELWENKLLWLKPSCLWYYVMAALANEHTHQWDGLCNIKTIDSAFTLNGSVIYI